MMLVCYLINGSRNHRLYMIFHSSQSQLLYLMIHQRLPSRVSLTMVLVLRRMSHHQPLTMNR